MKYYLYMEQEGEGCDYTIGCGARLVEIEIAEGDILEDRVIVAISDRGFDSGTYEAKRILLFANPIDMTHLAHRLRQQRLCEEFEQRRQQDEAEFERLRKKLGK